MSQQNIYALLVGIDKYQPPIPALDGCVNDMRAMRDYIVKRAERKGVPIHLEVLENQDATRVNVVTKFETHLTKAGKGDIAFFYYSGHGSQENAHEIFWPLEEEHKNETFVCYDSRMHDGMDLADKELATLIDMVAQNEPHIVVITDCCNSGDNTRSISETKTRQSPNSTAVRALDTYILPRNLSTDRSTLAVTESTNFIVPKPRHIALAAAHSSQLAKETYLDGSPRGVFTYSLLEVLENAVGPLTYEDLMRRVRSLVLQRTYDQNPQLSATLEDDVDLLFMDGSTSLESNYFILTHSRNDGWKVDAGSVHGMVAGTFGGKQALLWVYGEDASEAEMEDESRALGQVSISQVKTTESMVRIEGDLFLDTGSTYKAIVATLPISPLKVNVRGQDSNGIQLAVDAIQNGDAEVKTYVEAVNSPTEASYNLIASSNQYIVTRKMDRDDQPLIEQVPGFNANSAKKAVDNLVHISKWERIKNLDNPSSSLFSNSIRIDIYQPENNAPVATGIDGDIVFRYNHGGELPRFRVKVVNTGSQRLYCALLYMSSQYEIIPTFLHRQGGVWLDPGAELWAGGGGILQGGVHDSLASFGKNSIQETFKVIFATKDFDATLYEMNALNLPKVNHRGTGDQNTRSLAFVNSGGGGSDDWNATDLVVTIVRNG